LCALVLVVASMSTKFMASCHVNDVTVITTLPSW
jgi:hypothetical protein